VSFDDLRAKVEDSSLDPRLDMVWKDGMDEWKPAGLIDGLFERPGAPVDGAKKTSLMGDAINHQAPALRKPTPTQAIWPGARRRSLFAAAFVFPWVWYFAIEAAGPFLTQRLGDPLMRKILPFSMLAPLVLLAYLTIKRLTNLGMSRLWLVAFLAPVVNLWIGYRCFACPPGYAYHKKLDIPGILLALIYWLCMLAAVYLLFNIVSSFSGIFESSDLPKRLRELIRMA
jgi:uncharacterized membrane protein YhaH (DUF805 family)